MTSTTPEILLRPTTNTVRNSGLGLQIPICTFPGGGASAPLAHAWRRPWLRNQYRSALLVPVLPGGPRGPALPPPPGRPAGPRGPGDPRGPLGPGRPGNPR